MDPCYIPSYGLTYHLGGLHTYHCLTIVLRYNMTPTGPPRDHVKPGPQDPGTEQLKNKLLLIIVKLEIFINTYCMYVCKYRG